MLEHTEKDEVTRRVKKQKKLVCTLWMLKRMATRSRHLHSDFNPQSALVVTAYKMERGYPPVKTPLES